MLAGKYKLVITNNFNGCLVVCADSLAGLKEGYYEVKLSKVDKIHQCEGMVSLRTLQYQALANGMTGSQDVNELKVDEYTRWFGNPHFQIIFFNTQFHEVKNHSPEFFSKSFSTKVKENFGEGVSMSALRMIHEKMCDLKFGMKAIPDPLTRIALFEYATLAGVPISDDTTVVKVKSKFFLMDHEMHILTSTKKT